MKKLKWILPVLVGAVSMAVFAQNAQAGTAAVACATNDASRASNGDFQAIFFGDSKPEQILDENEARYVAREKCVQAGCSRCLDVCSGEGPLVMHFSYKMFSNAAFFGCEIAPASSGAQLTLSSELATMRVRVAASRCETKLSEELARRNVVQVEPIRCSTRLDALHYNSDPSNLPFEAHYY